jgi:hypothetical protein
VYLNKKSELKVRAFDFKLRNDEQVVLRASAAAISKTPGTRISLKNFDTLYGNKCPLSADVIQQRIIGHFIQILAAEISPAIIIADGSETVDLRSVFSALVKNSIEEKIDIVVDEEDVEPISLTIRHIRASKAIRPDANRKNYNWLFLSGNQRAVEESPLDDAIGLKLLSNEEVYVGCVYGEYLDKNVNQLRTAFTFSMDENRLVRRALVDSIMNYLHEYVTEIKVKKKKVTEKIISEYPQFLYLKSEMQEFVEKLAPGAVGRESVFVEMCRDRFRKTNQAHKVEHAIQAAPVYNAEVSAQMDQYRKFIEGQQKGVLAEYILLRKAIIDILDKYAGFQDTTDKNYLEEAIHKLIVPMRTESTRLRITDHNLWIIDDRLAFYGFFASDKTLKSYTDSTSMERADLAFFYDTCLAWEQKDSNNTVALVEFKRPGRDNYNGEDNPLRQLIGYIKQFKTSTSLKDVNGKTFAPRLKDAKFHCYIIADLTNSLREALSGYPFNDTPDKLGMFGYLTNPDAFVEIFSYEKLLEDSKKRNAIFFKHLGVTDIDPSISVDDDDETDDDPEANGLAHQAEAREENAAGIEAKK